ncbi:hypothetical protein HanXRQr2_Chr04g0145961 [Helianthus annuus]|uniref:Uncharacterized protein n=1 Tax=Helianthus annuus TaxID=4232 RepID=A0A251UVN2_HELAN|nr:hypothetical protein HanXRQr2_Chr04g0145961 [Helianthus annuus]KAJ0731968.1 hypothetical protein HanOQP8_Chr07g0257921 [Helianthus annuus]KAJ0905574.1 hypothetical protein HanPSC8_Chr07g0295511 [Helianthus annuus]
MVKQPEIGGTASSLMMMRMIVAPVTGELNRRRKVRKNWWISKWIPVNLSGESCR